MNLRLCSIVFKKDTKIQWGDHPKDIEAGFQLDLVHLGNMVSYGSDHICGVKSQQISSNPTKVKGHIKTLEAMSTAERVEWFANPENYGATIIKIKADRVVDIKAVAKNKEAAVSNPVAVINCSVDLKWTHGR
jgi:hypothetical protein